MIRTVADLLFQLVEREKQVLGGVHLVHAPTIGEMYEGLARSVLDQGIPEEFGLRWISGFVRSSEGRLSRQIDCMLVRGNGELIPHTEKEICGLDDVVAVVEIKKSLLSAEVMDAWQNLSSVTALYRNDEGSAQDARVSIDPLLRAFSSVTGKVFRASTDKDELPTLDRLIAHCLHFDLACPIRVVFGFEGYKTEKGLRDAFYTCLDRLSDGVGIPSIPNIISSGNFSLCKLTGFPYSSRVDDGWWGVVGSTSANPLAILLEHIFCRLSHTASIQKYLGADLEVEQFSRVLTARFRKEGVRAGWEYRFTDIPERELRARRNVGEWEPVQINQATAVFMQLLARRGATDLAEPFLVESARDAGMEPSQFADWLVVEGLVLWDAERLVPAFDNCAVVIQSDGTFVAGNASDHRLRNWVLRRAT